MLPEKSNLILAVKQFIDNSAVADVLGHPVYRQSGLSLHVFLYIYRLQTLPAIKSTVSMHWTHK